MPVKKIVFLLLFLLIILCCGLALADPAQDITKQCKFGNSNSKYNSRYVRDRNYGTSWISLKEAEPWIRVTAPDGSLCYGVYVCFSTKTPMPWKVQVPQGDGWVTVAKGAGLYLHEYVALPGVPVFRITTDAQETARLSVAELYVLGEGSLPGWVQVWEPTPGKVDILLITAHPDDEYVYFGGLLPDYDIERGYSVVVACMTYYNSQRIAELLNGLWRSGVRTYPSIGQFTDRYSKSAKDAYRICGGKDDVWEYVTALYRQYKPDVVVTHDINGEYGHGMHMACADAALNCVPLAADASKYPESVGVYGVWQVKKLYLHLYTGNQIHMDWDKPLAAFGGQTSIEIANMALKCHVSQQGTSFTTVSPSDHKHSAYEFGLYLSAVGQDVKKNDFMENIN
jgi:LmbE family N-acetylglucosaminyl deacetylase